MTYEIATNDIVMIPLNKLIPSGLNARKITTSAENNAELRASLLAFGVLENLIVYGAGKDKYAVAAGERRRASLKALLKEKKIPANFAVPCIVRPEDEAVELSLAENIIRVAMHPIDRKTINRYYGFFRSGFWSPRVATLAKGSMTAPRYAVLDDADFLEWDTCTICGAASPLARAEARCVDI